LKNDLFITLLICCSYTALVQNAYWKEVCNLLQIGKFGDIISHSEQVKYRSKSCKALFLYGLANYTTGKYKSSLSFSEESVGPAFMTVKRKYTDLSISSSCLNEEASADYSVYLSGIDPKDRGFNYCKNVIYECKKNIVFKSNEDFECTEHAGNELNSPNDEIRSIQFPYLLYKFYSSFNKQGFAGWTHNKFGDRNDKYNVRSFNTYADESEESSQQPVFYLSEQKNTSINKIFYAFNPDESKFITNSNFYA
jgi:hypothetical protein